MTKRIGLLTSGGDCGGLNAVIRAVALRAASSYGWEVLGIRNGSMGLLRQPPDAELLDPARLDAAMMRLGGTILGTTNKGDPFAFPMPDGSLRDRSQEVVDAYRALRLEALIGIGGDGSFAILRRLGNRAGFLWSGSRRRSTMTCATPRPRSATTRRLLSRPRRSTGCSRPRQATIA